MKKSRRALATVGSLAFFGMPSLLVALKRIVLNVVGLKERATSGWISNCLRLTIDLAWFCEPLGLLQGLGTANLFRSEAAAWLIVPIKER